MTPDPVFGRGLRLIGVRIRLNSGQTRQYEPQHLRNAHFALARGKAQKIFFTFRDEEGNLLFITHEHLGSNCWTVYGYRQLASGELQRIEGIPSYRRPEDRAVFEAEVTWSLARLQLEKVRKAAIYGVYDPEEFERTLANYREAQRQVQQAARDRALTSSRQEEIL